jgi:hypothetical protein
MLSRRLLLLLMRPALSVMAVCVLFWTWGCTHDPETPYSAPLSDMLLMAAAPAAGLITVEFNGVVTAVTDPNGDLQDNVGIGDSVVGLFTYD